MAASDILLLDADIVAYQLAAKAQKTILWPDCEEPTVWLGEWDETEQAALDVVQALQEKLKTEHVVVCLSCPSSENWRLDHLPTYKGNRAGVVKPEYLQPVKDFLAQAFPSYRKDRLEADDIMGILSTMPLLPRALRDEGLPVDGRRIIVSEDKDMKTIPGWLFNPAKDKAPRPVEEVEADYWHLYQTLVGDTTDGYSGCPGIGPKKAAKALLGNAPAAGWDVVRLLYRARGLTEQDALTQARVARICRHTDYDFINHKVIPWSPL